MTEPAGNAADLQLPHLPHVWRPRRARIVTYGMAVVVVLVMIVLAITLPHEGPREFELADRVGVVGVGLLVAAVLLLLARPRLEADDQGLTVVNMLRRRRLAWPQVVRVNFRRGDPWVFFDLDDGTTLAVMGIQSSDGEQARRFALQVRALVEKHSRTERND
ncbi:hypothetical protein C3Y87_16485 [Carbonactinospora thermoautotrophica]|uniref:Low molecular weight protein antigen 6 PH domain-containing protein n=1 Tax=Carbonactinospora thermoautotrophica TaxID=1469144 RepID=A0A132N580_9ACTN|nr:PH domain-containing protein [Carbonactinospora thermoautotrophica]KWX00744.1 hypothetical protein LI90_1767 [Carbonactinospora thermoautotrophica]KWX05288.1 hypothetical protein TH66_03340 [Carbonactinospora thermoautotrophica]KWX09244.1 hypothetical protein TR74_10790 [Carbonactinospora thermoautotrophica]MCX9192982.1 hypothetical protein [Carbonactinospora thermoautotrophica]